MMADFKPQDLSQLDKDRFSSYKSNLDFYAGAQWVKTSKNRQLVFNYSRIAVDKITSGYIVYPQATDSASYYLRFQK